MKLSKTFLKQFEKPIGTPGKFVCRPISYIYIERQRQMETIRTNIVSIAFLLLTYANSHIIFVRKPIGQ